MNYAKAIKLIRLLKGYSQVQAADLAGLDQSYLSKIENGARVPPIEIFAKIVNSLNVHL
ncbi:MAG: helix-turn-helix transcriptional regulator, partial [Candidatus Doudnabacteria bacterium]|nr:helix-turn-helix transcriptional regulator [Candidatus Doudnabacteria bacterium]